MQRPHAPRAPQGLGAALSCMEQDIPLNATRMEYTGSPQKATTQGTPLYNKNRKRRGEKGRRQDIPAYRFIQSTKYKA